MTKHIAVRMKEEFPYNIHPMPVALAWDGAEWECDLQARSEEGMDIDGFARAPTQKAACNKAFQRITKSRTMYERLGYVPN
jgi:hypothetical protein